MTKIWNEVQSKRYQQLVVLWQKAGLLNDKEFEQLCVLVKRILMESAKTGLPETGQSHEDLIHGYLVKHILEKVQTDPEKFKAQMPTSHGALILFFKQFVISLGRGYESRVIQRSEPMETETGELRHEVAELESGEGVQERLHAEGMSLETLKEQLYAFAAGLTPIQRQLLDNYFDEPQQSIETMFPGDKEAQSLARVAVAEMGLWYGKSDKRNPQTFAQTKLGHFMSRQIGQSLNLTHLPAVEALMHLIAQHDWRDMP